MAGKYLFLNANPYGIHNFARTSFFSWLSVGSKNFAVAGEYSGCQQLHITEDERCTMLDYAAEKQMVAVTIDTVENAINKLFGWDRFIKP